MKYSQFSPKTSMQKVILFVSKGENSSATRYRALQYFPKFIEAGWQPKHATISGGMYFHHQNFIRRQPSRCSRSTSQNFPQPHILAASQTIKKINI